MTGGVRSSKRRGSHLACCSGRGNGALDKAVQELVESEDWAGAALGAAHGALEASGQAPAGFGKESVSPGTLRGVFGELVGGAADVVGDGAGRAGELERDLLEVRRAQAGVVDPVEYGLGEAFVGSTVEGKFAFDVSVRVVRSRGCCALISPAQPTL
jgi:hypothetical protein